MKRKIVHQRYTVIVNGSMVATSNDEQEMLAVGQRRHAEGDKFVEVFDTDGGDLRYIAKWSMS